MPKFRNLEEKHKIILYLLSTKPNCKDRPFEHTDEYFAKESTLKRLYKYEPLWDKVDKLIGKPLTERGRCELWNLMTEALHWAR